MKGKIIIFLVAAGSFLALTFCRSRKPCRKLTVAGETSLMLLGRMSRRLRRKILQSSLLSTLLITLVGRFCKKMWYETIDPRP